MFKRKQLQTSLRSGVLAVATAFAGFGATGLSTSANAVNIANDGLGEVLIFPYYSARNGFASFFNITNTSDDTVVLKVRWYEGENSRDARDFNVILSPHDIWSVATLANRTTGAAHARTGDNSCTSPLLPVDGNGSGSTHGIDFTNLAYTGSNKDTGNAGLDRTREGYFIVFEMGIIDKNLDPLTPTGKDAANIIASALHSKVGQNQGVPGAGDSDTKTNCGLIDKLFSTEAGTAKIAAVTTEPENNLKGRGVLIELGTGVAHGYDPTVLANFSTSQMITAPGTAEPSLNQADPAISIQSDDNNAGIPVVHAFARGVDAVSDLLSRTTVINDYNITGESQTDWVITFPTKSFYVDRKQGAGYNGKFYRLEQTVANRPLPPFDVAEVFSDPDRNSDGRGDNTNSLGESCLPIGFRLWDREEFEKADAVSGFSPQGDTADAEICKEANILSFGNSNIFDSKLRSALFENNVGALPGQNGWAEITFKGTTPGGGLLAGGLGRGVLLPTPKLPGAATSTFAADAAAAILATSNGGNTAAAALAAVAAANLANGANPDLSITYGLPVIGMRLEARQNSQFSGKSYGFASDHAYKRN